MGLSPAYNRAPVVAILELIRPNHSGPCHKHQDLIAVTELGTDPKDCIETEVNEE